MLLSSAPSLDAIKDSVTRFYCGEEKTLQQVSEMEWRLAHGDGEPLSGVRIVKKGRRFRFEMIDA